MIAVDTGRRELPPLESSIMHQSNDAHGRFQKNPQNPSYAYIFSGRDVATAPSTMLVPCALILLQSQEERLFCPLLDPIP